MGRRLCQARPAAVAYRGGGPCVWGEGELFWRRRHEGVFGVEESEEGCDGGGQVGGVCLRGQREKYDEVVSF